MATSQATWVLQHVARGRVSGAAVSWLIASLAPPPCEKPDYLPKARNFGLGVVLPYMKFCDWASEPSVILINPASPDA